MNIKSDVNCLLCNQIQCNKLMSMCWFYDFIDMKIFVGSEFIYVVKRYMVLFDFLLPQLISWYYKRITYININIT